MQFEITIRDVITAAQSLASIILAVLVWHHYQKRGRRHLRYWAFGWFSLAVYSGVNACADWWLIVGNPLDPRWLTWSTVAHSAVYSTSILFLAGGYDLLHPGRLRRPHLYLALSLSWVLAAGLVLGSTTLTSLERYLLRSGLSTMWLGVALLVTASFVGRAAAKRQLGTYFLTVFSVAFGTLKLLIFAAIALALVGNRVLLEASVYFGPLDLLLGFCVGIGMLIWQIEEETQAAIDATNALRESESLLRQSQKMEAVGQLAGGIAHDFNNLLTVIQGYSEILTRAASSGSDAHQAADEIKRATRRASSLTQNLLAFSRQQVLEPQSVELGDLVRQVTAVADRATTERIKLEARISEERLPVHLDPGQFQQLLLNLIINARDAMPDGGTITVSASSVNDASPSDDGQAWCRIEVKDEGEGMSSEVLARIFDPFFSTKKEGTGLGLPTAAGIVEQSGGRIEVDSSPGRGSRFSVFLPLTFDDGPLTGELPAFPGAESKTVLLVEDEVSVRKLVTTMLENEGYSVRSQPSAEEALADLQADNGVDLILTDVMLPGMSGPDFIEIARGLCPDLPAILMTGYAAEDVGLVQEGSYAVIRKPFASKRVLEAVYQALAI